GGTWPVGDVPPTAGGRNSFIQRCPPLAIKHLTCRSSRSAHCSIVGLQPELIFVMGYPSKRASATGKLPPVRRVNGPAWLGMANRVTQRTERRRLRDRLG